jgi:hypothetical protein
MTRRRAWARATTIAALSFTACRGGCSACAGPSRDAIEAGVVPVDTAMVMLDSGPMPDAGVVLAPARCTATGTLLPLAPAPALGDLAIGDAVATSSGFAIGMIRRQPNAGPGRPGKVLSVAVLTPSLDKVSWVDLGTPHGDDPPPRPFLRDGAVWVAWYEHARDASTSRALIVAPLPGADYKAQPGVLLPQAVSSPQGVDESLAFDVATKGGASPTLVAWDDDGAKGGTIKVAVAGAEGVVVSPETTDAESPRIAPRAGGWWLTWIARRPDLGEEAGIEGPGEDRTHRWLEAVTLDEAGKRVGDVHRVTPASGHIAAYDVLPSMTGLELVAREDDELHEGSGSKILRVALGKEGASPVTTLVREGAGGGGPDLVGAGEVGWAVFSDPLEHLRIVPVPLAATPSNPIRSVLPSAEPAFEGGRVLAIAAGPRANPADPDPALLAVTEKGEARFVHCAR